MVTQADQQTVDNLRRRDEAAFRLLYKAFYPMVERMVTRHKGTKADAADVFQDTLLVLLDKLDHEDWQLTASLKTYLYAISHKIWLKRLHTGTRFDVGIDPFETLADDLNTDDDPGTPVQRLGNWLGQITQHCQTLLRRLFLGESAVPAPSYKNKHTAQNQQYKCLQQIRRVAQQGQSDE